MSLLLDALKKAAAEKQKGSAADKPSTAEPVTNDDTDDELELELDEQALDTRLPEANEPEPLIEDGHKAIRAADDFDAELPTLDIPSMEQHREQVSETAPQGPAIEQQAVQEEPSPVEQQVVLDVTAEAQGGTPEAHQEDPLQFADQHSQPAPRNEAAASGLPTPTPPPVPDRRSQVSPRSALDMMINKSREATERRHRTIRNIGLLVFLLILLAGGSYFYYDSQQQIAELKRRQPMVASEAIEPTDDETQAPEIKPVSEQIAVNVDATSASVQPVSDKPRPVAKQQPANTKPVAKPAAKTPIQLERKVVEDPIHVLLSEAYEHFNAERFDTADRLYKKVLQREPDNRDALLGTAAVAIKQQRLDDSRQRYQQLLLLDPKDSLARAGLAGLDSDDNSESRLKFMLREQPDAAHLYFALGALYAEQTRWPEAQQAFFNAWSNEPDNADYAYNLAVSLDQLGKYAQAEPIYRDALKLAQGKAVAFNSADVQARVDQLGKRDHE